MVMTTRRVAPDDTSMALLTCTACGMQLLVDPEDLAARLFHQGDGAHRVLPVDPAPRPIAPAGRPSLRADVLAVAIRLHDAVEDLERIMAALDTTD